ncbi:GAP family protein [Candidatus Saccharibacteria bacterium]|jgi:cytochrome c biogenesis protein CcdA|nr:GAP family protein [Candidatus Saccharibacteria bacterium]
MLDLPTLTVVLGSAAIDSINPCAIGVLILMVSVIMGTGKNSTKRLLTLGGAYIFSIFATYLIAGLGLVYFFSAIPIVIAEYLSLAVGVLVILAGVLEIKDYFWYGKGFSLQIPPKAAAKIKEMSNSNTTTVSGIMALGAFVAAVELPCTGAPYLAIITILRVDWGLVPFLLMVLYNFIFVLPLIIILIMVAGGAKLSSVKKWKEESKGAMRLLIGLLLVALGWMLILIANGTINFG